MPKYECEEEDVCFRCFYTEEGKQCLMEFNTYRDFRVHHLVHAEIRPYTCRHVDEDGEECLGVFKSTTQFKRHIQLHNYCDRKSI